MDNREKFRTLYNEFDMETKKKVNNKSRQLKEIIIEFKNKRINPYYNEFEFIDFCNWLRNKNSHENGIDKYLLFTDELVAKLYNIVNEVKHPYTVYSKCTHPVYSVTVKDNVRKTMEYMLKKNYTHVPVYDENKNLVGIFSERVLFNYILNNQILQIDDNTVFDDIKDCIDINNGDYLDLIKFVSKDLSYDDVVNDYIAEFKNNEKLSCVLVTQNGKNTEFILGIITAWDIIGR